MAGIFVIGSLNMDITVYVDRFPQRGETIPGEDMIMMPGGKGSNQALAAARLGGRVAMAGCVGSDVYADALIDDLAESAVDVSHIRRLADCGTGMALITVCHGDNTIIIHPGANNRISAADVDALEDVIAQSDALILQFEIPQEAVDRAVTLAKKHHCLVFINPAPYRAFDSGILRGVDYFIPNETEAMAMLGLASIDLSNAEAALRRLAAMGVKTPIITMGEQGVAYLKEGVYHHAPCHRVKAVDATAAGDTFIGAFASAIVRGEAVGKAIDHAQRAAAYCVAHKGAHSSIPTADDLEGVVGDLMHI